MKLLPLLIVTVLGVGGPRVNRPSRLADGVITVTRSGRTIASSKRGRLERRLPPGRYRVSGALLPPDVAPGRICQVKWVELARGHTTDIDLYCSIK